MSMNLKPSKKIFKTVDAIIHGSSPGENFQQCHLLVVQKNSEKHAEDVDFWKNCDRFLLIYIQRTNNMKAAFNVHVRFFQSAMPLETMHLIFGLQLLRPTEKMHTTY